MSIDIGAFRTRVFVATAVLALLAIVFWTQSRVPDLNNKAMMGGGLLLEDPLSFEAHYPISENDSFFRRVALTSLNWAMTNRRGMLFGLLFGAAALTLLRYLPRRSVKGGFGNAALGMLFGAPLGVCVNCAAPIARGMFAGGSRIETALATMIASPTLNVIVLTMAFSLLPPFMIAIKLVLTIAVILILIPAIGRLLPEGERISSEPDVAACVLPPQPVSSGNEPIVAAVWGFVRDYCKDLWFLIRVTVPLMIAAGVLGAIVANLIPVESFGDLPVTLPYIAMVVAVGLFLPAPVAFDIVLAAGLFAAGAPVAFVMAILFSAGIFSIYSYMIVAGSISRRAANLLVAGLFVLGILAAYSAEAYQRWEFKRALDALGVGLGQLVFSAAHAAEIETTLVTTFEEENGATIDVSMTPFAPRSAAAEKPFTRLEAWKIGIDRPNRFSMKDMTYPFQQAPGSVAAADMDNDGDPDVVLADVQGALTVFLNDGTGQFSASPIELPDLAGLPFLIAAPVDLNNDGWMDLVITSFAEGEFALLSNQGQFGPDGLARLPNRDDARFVLSLAFGDLDMDGDLDVVLGNNSGLPGSVVKGEFDRNRIVYNENGSLGGTRHSDLPGMPGETLTLLVSDWNRDGVPDLIAGNDYSEPDIFYSGDGKGAMRQITADDSIFPVTTNTTMSVKSADFDNDGRFELFLSQIAGRPTNLSGPLELQGWNQHCEGLERATDQQTCNANLAIKFWYDSNMMRFSKALADKCVTLPVNQQWECRSLMLRNLAFLSRDAKFCERIPDDNARIRMLCRNLMAARQHADEFRGASPPEGTYDIIVDQDLLPKEIPQLFGHNVLLVDRGDGTFEDRAEAANLAISGWSWDVKIFDFDNDGLQDIHILNGDWGLNALMPSNIYLTNLGDLKFRDQTKAAGLIDFAIMPSSAAADYDNDGDIDQIAQTVNGPLYAYWNNVQTGNSITVELQDFIGNRNGIGAKIMVEYDGGRRQWRELKLSGGYLSFDEAVAHFGLGSATVIERIEIHWLDGRLTRLEGPLSVNSRYLVERNLP